MTRVLSNHPKSRQGLGGALAVSVVAKKAPHSSAAAELAQRRDAATPCRCNLAPAPGRAGFEGLERVPSMFVLMGNFQSYAASSASTDYAQIRDNFGALAALLAFFPRIVVRPAAASSTRVSPSQQGQLCVGDKVTGPTERTHRRHRACCWRVAC